MELLSNRGEPGAVQNEVQRKGSTSSASGERARAGLAGKEWVWEDAASGSAVEGNLKWVACALEIVWHQSRVGEGVAALPGLT